MISGKGFADKCQWCVDPRYPERPSFSYVRAKAGDWVFVNGDFVMEYASRIPFVCLKKFHIIVHNSDRPFTQRVLSVLLQSAVHVYAINTTFRHPQLTTIPIGFVDRQLDFLASPPKPAEERTIDIYCNFTIGTNAPKRRECLEAWKDSPRVVFAGDRSVPEYYADLCRSKFVLCPEGTGVDTHRVYEALLCGATPVVLRNSLSHLYEKLPVCIVDAWTDEFSVPTGRNFSTEVNKYL